jgi:phytoene dehydrogenase-like protein
VRYDAIVIGSGPNGLAAAITIARAGRSVLVLEGADTPGGGLRSEELTLPGFLHDVCASVHPLALASPFFRTLPLEEHGLRWVQPEIAFAHPLGGDCAALVHRSLDETAAGLGADGPAYRRLFRPIVRDWDRLTRAVLGPLFRVPESPLVLARFGLHALCSVAGLARSRFREPAARALLAGAASHSIVPLNRPGTAAFGLLLTASAHAGGWPFAEGGSRRLTDALVSVLRSLGGELRTGEWVTSLAGLPPARAVLCDVTPRQFLALAGDRLPAGYRRALERFRYGPGVFKVDWALAGPIPWRAEQARRAGTLHVGGTLDEVAAAEAAPWDGRVAERPLLVLAQPSVFDPTRAPRGLHTAWAYCHVPNGSTEDMTERIEMRVERFAPGFRDRILARHTLSPADFERHNPNLVGGDLAAGAMDLAQLFFRPVRGLHPYDTPIPGVFLCSASTPPGGGVHGMCGHLAATRALATVLRTAR